MGVPCVRPSGHSIWPVCRYLVGLLGLFLLGCNAQGEQSDALAPPPLVTPTLEQETITNLLDLYQTALRQEDIDRLDGLLWTASTSASASLPQQPTRRQGSATFSTAMAFRAAITEAFRAQNFIDIRILEPDMQLTSDPPRVSFLEVQSVEDPLTRGQRTLAVRSTFQLVRRASENTVTFFITAVLREGPQFQVTISGQVRAGAPTRLIVTENTGTCALDAGDIEVPETGEKRALMVANGFLHGVFVAPLRPAPQPLRVAMRGLAPNGATCGQVVSHGYRTRRPGEGVVQPISGTENTRFFAIAVAPDGTIFGGGERGATIQRVPPGATTALPQETLLANPHGRVEDIIVDRLGRLHFLFVDLEEDGVVGNGDVVFDQRQAPLFCQTVNVLAPNYPFSDAAGRPSTSTRALAALGGNIWLFGSDGGVAQVADTFRQNQCLQNSVTYAPLFRRQSSPLLSNTVPALLEEQDGTLWFGTAFGLTRRAPDGTFTPVPFRRDLSFRGNVATLETFFQTLVQAISNALPLTTIALGNVSFVETFGSPLVKEDLIFSLASDSQGRLWVGTLGGGLRRIERRDGIWQDGLLLTRQQGLVSNNVFALAVGTDDTVWVATDKGVSQIQELDGGMTFTTFTALDGLPGPVRDVALDTAGTPWMATDAGLFRIIRQGARIDGVVHDPAGQPVAGVDVIVQGTPFRAVTDNTGYFLLENLPPRLHRVLLDGILTRDEAFLQMQRDVDLSAGDQHLGEIEIVPGQNVQLKSVSGDGQLAIVGTPLPLPLVVEALDAAGRPLAGVPVTFTITEGNGILSSASMRVTDAQGQASVTLQLGTTAGRNLVQASIAALQSVLLVATGQADRSTPRLLQIAGNTQHVRPGEVLPAPLLIRLEDQFGNPLADEEVSATVLAGSGVLLSDTVASSMVTDMTDAQGEARFFLRVEAMEDRFVLVGVSAFGQTVEFLTVVGFIEPVGIVEEPDGRLVVADAGLQAVVRVDPSSGQLTPVSGQGIGHGTPLQSPAGLFRQLDGSLIVTDTTLAAVVRVDPISGQRTIISDASTGNGPALVFPQGIAGVATGVLFLADLGLTAVVRVDPVSGNRTIVSDATTGAGPLLAAPLDVVVETEHRLLVVDSSIATPARIVRVDLASGNREIVSDTTTGSGVALADPVGLTVQADGQLVVVDATLMAVLRVDPHTGNRTVLSDATTGSGALLTRPRGVTSSATGTHLAVTDTALASVVLVDQSTGERQLLAGLRVGGGPPLNGPMDIAVEADGRLVVVDSVFGAPSVVRIDPNTGNRTVLSDAFSAGIPFEFPQALAVEADGQLVVGEASFDATLASGLASILRVDPVTGARSVVSRADLRGAGAPLQLPQKMVVGVDASLVVVDFGDPFLGIAPAILRVDPVSGNRTIVSDATTGSGPQLLAPQGVVVEASGDLVVVDAGDQGQSRQPAVMRLDPGSGNRKIVSDAMTGTGPLLVFPSAIAVEASGTLLVLDRALAAVIQVDPTSGNRALVTQGPPLLDPVAIAVQSTGNLLVLDGPFGIRAVVQVIRRSGVGVIVSR